ncbi:MAG TPA: hypothetical protein VL984_04970 [Acidimicrobiales bacterium]|nr:hypothetical protein [Acidimicrobiales bacterium]
MAPSPSAFAGAFGGAYAPAWLVPRAGLGETGTIVAAVALLGMAVTLTTLPGPRGQSLDPLSDKRPRRRRCARHCREPRHTHSPSLRPGVSGRLLYGKQLKTDLAERTATK